jgi:Ecdysteroid kinase-like family
MVRSVEDLLIGDNEVQPVRFPNRVEDITPGILTDVISQTHPGAAVDGFDIISARGLGKMVSTAGRATLDLRYRSSSPPLPRRVIVKMTIDKPGAPGVLFETEVGIYKRMLPELSIEKAFFLGGTYDDETEQFGLILEDLSERGATFPNALETPVTARQVGVILDLLATVHAQYWNSPRLDSERSWLSSLVDGTQFDFFDKHTVPLIDELVSKSVYRQSLITRLGRNPKKLWGNVKAVHRYHSRLPQTLLHGDTGVHNSYHLPNGKIGMIDWQLSVRGPWPHDVHYIICTALTTEDRRKNERMLVQRYLHRLADLGVRELPGLDEAMQQYARAIVWGFTIGWLMAPTENYGPDILKANLDRLIAAAEDWNSFSLADAIS